MVRAVAHEGYTRAARSRAALRDVLDVVRSCRGTVGRQPGGMRVETSPSRIPRFPRFLAGSGTERTPAAGARITAWRAYPFHGGQFAPSIAA
jgi:hypothetical protein